MSSFFTALSDNKPHYVTPYLTTTLNPTQCLIQIKPLVRSLTLTLSLHTREALGSTTIVVQAVDVDNALVVVALVVRNVQDTVTHALLQRRLAAVVVLLVQLPALLARISGLVDLG